ncbi:MAG TPA: hypothetical protein VFW32_08120 [Actinomycetes bacterium]|nr:hypothetical protein [Actinomycetes bacterium]
MATDRDEQQREQQRQELEEIRRSFAEMGARMGSLFEPAEADESERARQAARSASSTTPPTPAPGVFQARPRWWWAGLLALLFVAGTAFGWLLPRGGDGPEAAPPPQATTATTAPQASATQATRTRTVVSVPEACVDAAELADEVISRLNRNDRDNRLALALRDYTIASQACRREASP